MPAEPLAKLATATHQADLIEYHTIAAANFALWRVHVFNQLVGELADFYAAHLHKITRPTAERHNDEGEEDDDEREDDDARKALARGAATLSWFRPRPGDPGSHGRT